MMRGQVIAMGGGGFSMEPGNPALDLYILRQTRKTRPRVCFLAQASGESQQYILNFFAAFSQFECIPGVLSLFQPHTADIEGYLMQQDVIYVGGGNTKSLLALWREWELDRILREACAEGTVLAGISAGANCWFEACTTDSYPGDLRVLRCLGYLSGSMTPHYDGEPKRRPTLHRMIAAGEIVDGYAFDDSAAGHFVHGELRHCVASNAGARGYRVERVDGRTVETPLDTRVLP